MVRVASGYDSPATNVGGQCRATRVIVLRFPGSRYHSAIRPDTIIGYGISIRYHATCCERQLQRTFKALRHETRTREGRRADGRSVTSSNDNGRSRHASDGDSTRSSDRYDSGVRG
jgi:hypothetical protein